MNTQLEAISRQLARMGTSGSFATRCTAPANDLHLEVEGVGRIRFPITVATARRLCEIARPARHGFKDQTRLDRRVRDTWEIPRSWISIDAPRWNRTLAPQLDRIRRDLGLAEGCRLKAELQNLLIYAPGQFFVTHQDSEKADNMIGSLVVSLPSRYTGGAMAVEHHDEKKLFSGSGQSGLTFVAFYANCHHEVRPVKQGYRVVLTYNLVVNSEAAAAGSPADGVAALTRHAREFFETSSPPRWPGAPTSGPPDRLVYLLDHQYTQRGLAWGRLKSGDAARAAALEAAAQQLDCDTALALADVHETWQCEEEEEKYGYGRHGRRRAWGYDEEEENGGEPDDGSSDHELIDLVDSDVELRHWVGSRPRAMSAGVDSEELCFTKPSVEFEPFESEHEGYMGNYGNTVDRWYHRAAVVLWPRDRTFIIRAKASPRWAVGEIGKKIESNKTTEGLSLVQRLLPFWKNLAGHGDGQGLIEATLIVAAKLNDAKTAGLLLQPFTLTAVTARATTRVADLLERYGVEWSRTLLRQWTSEKNVHELVDKQIAWIRSALPALCRAWCARSASDGQALAREVLDQQWAWMLDRAKGVQKHSSAKDLTKELARLGQPMLALMQGALIAKHSDLKTHIVNFLTNDAGDLPERLPLGVLRAAYDHCRADALPQLVLKPVHAWCSRSLAERLNKPARAEDDWSITTSVRCSCKLCATLTRYLRAADQKRFEWPLAKNGRAHIHGVLDSNDLPVTQTTRRTGSPFTLVLEKTRAVFARDASERESWREDAKWLARTAEAF